MDRYEETLISLNIALHGGLSLAIKMVSYEGPLTALTITLHGGL
jgi:hypothetical protein